jgi:hypothetical protein
LELSRGGNSHQSETNLIEKTPEAILPGARKGFSAEQALHKKQTPTVANFKTDQVCTLVFRR